MARLTSDETYEKCHRALELAGYARCQNKTYKRNINNLTMSLNISGFRVHKNCDDNATNSSFQMTQH